MKVNLPVTQREVLFPQECTLVSRTDLKGVITSANDEFVRISGYAVNELVGSSHNIVRHPDMPKEAFADLWAVVKSGRPWRGLVKNRTRTGDHYWVEANVTPLYDAGKLAGYQSVRCCPERARVSAAETLYREVREGRKAFPATQRSFTSRIPFSSRTLLTVVPLSIVTLGAGLGGYLGLPWVSLGAGFAGRGGCARHGAVEHDPGEPTDSDRRGGRARARAGLSGPHGSTGAG